ncbi:MAG: hypothetical protein MRY83_14265 [Flavobacteriales bacterium]|nr:hypothetical protein [Flavobacteriales bacterium]
MQKRSMLFFLLVLHFKIGLTSTFKDSIRIELANAKTSHDSGKQFYNLAWAEFAEKNYQKSSILGRKSFDYALAVNEDSTALVTCRLLGGIYGIMKKGDSSIYYVEQGLLLAEKLQDSTNIAIFTSILGGAYNNKGNYHQSFIYYDRSDSVFHHTKNYVGLVFNANARGVAYQELGMLNDALHWFYKAIEYQLKEHKYDKPVALISNIGDVYMEIGQYQEARLKFEEVINFCKDSNKLTNQFLGDAYLGMSKLKALEGSLDSCVFFANEAIKTLQSIGLTRDEMEATLYLASQYFEFEMYDSSIVRINQVDTSELSTSRKIEYFMLRARHLQVNGDLKLSKYWYAKALANSEALKSYRLQKDALLELINLGKNQDDAEAVLKFQKELDLVEDSINSQEQKLSAQRLFMQNRLAKKNNEIEGLKETTTTLQEKNKWIGISVGILILFIVLMILRYKNREKNLYEKHQKEKDGLDKELLYKANELQELALALVHKNEIIANIKEELAKNKASSQSEKLKQDLIVAQNDLNLQKSEQEFEQHIQNINDKFYIKLEQQFGSLTDYEKRLCSLLMIKLSSKDIATLMNISSKSVDMSRYRLRKKFQLNKGDDLVEFLKSL